MYVVALLKKIWICS